MDLDLMYYAYRTGNVSAEEYIRELEEVALDKELQETCELLQNQVDHLQCEINNYEYEQNRLYDEIESLNMKIEELKEDLCDSYEVVRDLENRLWFLSDNE